MKLPKLPYLVKLPLGTLMIFLASAALVWMLSLPIMNESVASLSTFVVAGLVTFSIVGTIFSVIVGVIGLFLILFPILDFFYDLI